jgi:hypothetical protein
LHAAASIINSVPDSYAGGVANLAISRTIAGSKRVLRNGTMFAFLPMRFDCPEYRVGRFPVTHFERRADAIADGIPAIAL